MTSSLKKGSRMCDKTCRRMHAIFIPLPIVASDSIHRPIPHPCKSVPEAYMLTAYSRAASSDSPEACLSFFGLPEHRAMMGR